MRSPLILAFIVFLAGCGRPEGGGEEASATSVAFRNVEGVAFVGDEACASCHEDLFASYQHHGMAQSLYAMSADRAVEDFSGVVVTHPPSGFSYTAYERDGRFWQEEYRLDAQGSKTHRLVREMEYVVGSGTAARTYLTEENGRYYELPLTWYTQADGGRGRWDLSPGYEEGNQRFDRLIPAPCMACHNGVSEPVPFVPGKFASIADGIGCERCHGPGALHVEARLENPEPTDSVDRTIVNPAHLSLDLRLDVCQQCHLNGTISLLRDGEKAFGYRPSQPLAAHLALFELEDERPGTIAVISHADRMKMSPCFTESAAMDCTTCHNPHEGFRDQGPAYFNDTCTSCHATDPLQETMPTAALRAEHAPGADCFACHMPKVEAEDAPHSSFTDHYIRVVRAEDRVTGQVAESEEAELKPYFERDEEGEGPIYHAMALVAYGRQKGRRDVVERGARELEQALAESEGFGEAHFLLGFARMQLGRPAAAVPALRESLRLEPGIPERMNALAQALEATGGPPAEIERLYRDALGVQPALADVRVNLGRFLETQGRVAEAASEYRAAADEQPWLAAAHYNLGTALLRLGVPPADAARHLETAVELEPDHADALVNLGVVRAQSGDLAAAGRLFQRAADAAPDDPNVLNNLGTFHLQQNDFRRAVVVLARAVALDPNNTDATANLALAHFQLGDAASARRYAEQALRLAPGHPTARQILGAL